MSIEERIRSHLQQDFAPTHLELENESAKHNFSRGPEGHFKLVIVSDKFSSLTRVERHQAIFKVLAEEMKTVHALAIRALAPNEWRKESENFNSPDCHHKR